jgi:glutamate/tyrosine decarboxylase-like PLP-dependent enzyme
MSLTIPGRGVPHDELLAQMSKFRDRDADWKSGRVFSLVYYGGDEHHAFLEKAHELFFAENALNPMAFASLRRMEAEVVRMTCAMLHGGPETVGTMTSGGTESCLLAVKTARDRARALNKRITKPNLVVPETIHVAFDKAASYFGLEIRYARVRSDRRADVRDLASLVDASTVLIAASAPQYPHGVVDPIEEIGRLAARKNIPFHVDACVGGFVLPWLEQLGEPIPLWDYRVPGVTSISADLHKYGLAEKGASTITYRDMSYLRHQFFVSTDWPGGIYASPSIPGTRPGGNIAAAWAALMALGEDGYKHHAGEAMKAARRLIDGLEAIPELELVARPDAPIVAYKAREGSGIDIFALADQLEDHDWSVDRMQSPNCIHLTVTSNHARVVDEYLEDVRTAVAWLAAHPNMASRGNAAMYGMMAKVPFRGMVKSSVLEIMEKMYGPNAADPDFAPLGGKDDGLVMRLVKEYGSKASALLERAEKLRDRLPLPKRRRS